MYVMYIEWLLGVLLLRLFLSSKNSIEGSVQVGHHVLLLLFIW